MANNYFQFKQFRIEQGRSALKVTTEGCLFGSLVSPQSRPSTILDIGTGTGLLSLMMAQKFPDAQIHGVEIDAGAFEQTKANFEASPWADRLRVFDEPIQNFIPGDTYDLIIANPPFFKNSLQGKRKTENTAKHESALSQRDLLQSVDRLLSSDGEFWVLYPAYESNQFRQLAQESNFYLTSQTPIYNRERESPFRVIQRFMKQDMGLQTSNLVIRDQDSQYSQDFKRLLSPFYLHL